MEILKPDSQVSNIIKYLLQTFYKFQCIDGMLHNSPVGKNKMFLISCDNKLDVFICKECWSILTTTCSMIDGDKNKQSS